MYFLYYYIWKYFTREFLKVAVSKLDASCKACLQSSSLRPSAAIFSLAPNSWPFLRYPRAYISDEQGNLSPLGL